MEHAHTTSADMGWNFENTYARLPPVLFEPATPVRVRAPAVTVLNNRLADELGLSFQALSDNDTAGLFAGQWLPPGAEPIAQAYAGHQFGGFTMLGDGRAILLGEQRAPSGTLHDIQFKGSGPTQFSRNGDGRAALGPMLREFIISEAMQALGIPTTRSLAVVTTGEPVYRERRLPGAILTRVASSHIRVGTFQYLAARQDRESLRILADYAIERHYSELAEAPHKYLELLRTVMDRQASLIVQWQLVGFIHGVMNTDNMAISGETIDYGPCAFMDAYHPETVFSSIDHAGRYAYGNQPAIGLWNLARFAESLLVLLDDDPAKGVEVATEVLSQYTAIFARYWLMGMRKKLGLETTEEGDRELVQELLDWMQAAGADFTNTFHDLSSGRELEGDVYREPRFQDWYALWRQRVDREGKPPSATLSLMQGVNPCVIPRNHRVEEALSAAAEGDLSPMHRLWEVLSRPFDRSRDGAEYQVPPPPGQAPYRTFCGT